MKSRTGYTYFDQKKKRWVGRVMLPADPVTGKRKSVRRFGLTEADVRKKLRKLVNIIEDEGVASIPVEKLTFADVAKEYEEKELIPAEYIGEKKVAGRRDLRAPKAWLKSLTEHFGKKRLTQITFGDIKAYKLVLIRRPVHYNQQSSNGVPKEGQGAEEVKRYGLEILRQLREALGYVDIANLIAGLDSRSQPA